MGIKDSLRDLDVALGGDGEGTTIGDLIDSVAASLNPMAALTVDTDIDEDTDLLGKTITDLQRDIMIRDNTIYGVVYYHDDYTGFSGDTELQSGYYLALHAFIPDDSTSTISVKVTDNKPLDSDGIMIIRLTDTVSKTITVTATDGTHTFSKTYNTRGLTLKKE